MIKIPGTKYSLLSKPSKMPGHSFDLPALSSCPSACGTICDGCYALRGNYRWPAVKLSQQARFKWTVETLKKDPVLWAAIVTYAIKESNDVYFRIHSSGDFFSPLYTKMWFLIAKELPNVKFWAPTKSWLKVTKELLPVVNSNTKLLYWLRQLNSLPNVTIRPSAINVGDSPPLVKNLAGGSSVSCDSDIFNCPSKNQNNQCLDCRFCWDNKNEKVNYKWH